jgi:hypothetical protein
MKLGGGPPDNKRRKIVPTSRGIGVEAGTCSLGKSGVRISTSVALSPGDSNDKANGAGWRLFQPQRVIGRHGPGIPGASREANHVHRRSDEHRAWWDQRRLVASHRLPSGEVALMKRFVSSLLRAVAEKISIQVW